MSRLLIVAALSLAALGAGCAYYPTFGFPVEEGDVEAGRQAFVDHRCHECHSVAGVRLPDLAGASDPLLELGGETSQIKAYSELVSSIINPDHRISERYREEQRIFIATESPMPMRHIDTMTVRQMIDIVAFLDSRYILIDDYEYDFGF
ncbi:MAG: cytochrome c [Gammaproteobacteria bacterium]|nr:cytochrome c [Gammaproteobacteria bacterium]